MTSDSEIQSLHERVRLLEEACEDISRLTTKDIESLPPHAVRVIQHAAQLSSPITAPPSETKTLPEGLELLDVSAPAHGFAVSWETYRQATMDLAEVTEERDTYHNRFEQAQRQIEELQRLKSAPLANDTVRELLAAYRRELILKPKTHPNLAMVDHLQISNRISQISKILEASSIVVMSDMPASNLLPASKESWEVVDKFAAVMKRKLEENRWKGGWQDDGPHLLLGRAIEELSELVDVMKPRGSGLLNFQHAIRDLSHAKDALDAHYNVEVSGNPEEILNEAADVANMLLMVADTMGAFEEKS